MTTGHAHDIAPPSDQRRHLKTVAAAVACVCLAVGSAAADSRVIKPQAGPLDAGDGFSFADKSKETRQSVSGIACPPNTSGKHICLIVFDEGAEARYATIDGNSFKPDLERVILRDKDGELDAEGAATDGRFFYVTGSHSVKRNNCEKDPARQHVLRFAVDPGTGRAARDANGKLTDYIDSGRLPALMALLPELKQHLGKCLGDEQGGGANIEGLAIRNERLFFGFRGPAKNKRALILSVDAAAFFQGTDAKPEVTRIVVGGGRGIRDLHAVKDGILVLAGPDDDEDNKHKSYRVALWDGKNGSRKAVKPKMLAQLDLKKIKLRDCDKETKPEALAVLEDSPKRYRIMILSDGMCDGGPLLFDIPR